MDYYIDTSADNFGFYQIHKDYCKRLPEGLHRLFLGNFENPSLAICVAKTYFFPKVKGCRQCCESRENI